MIDSQNEELLTLGAAARRVPGRKPGKGLNPTTLWRWHIRGVHGVRLETLLIGGTRYTSLEALQRFYVATTQTVDGVISTDTVARRNRAAEAAERSLIAAGM